MCCKAWGGTCSNGAMLTLVQRTGVNQCGKCNPGYYLSNKLCYGFSGGCVNGKDSVQAKRTKHKHCGSCNAGYILSNGDCKACGISTKQVATDKCTNCAPGQFGTTIAQTACIECDHDTYQSSERVRGLLVRGLGQCRTNSVRSEKFAFYYLFWGTTIVVYIFTQQRNPNITVWWRGTG